jgi:hypothetical protein
MNDDDDRSTSVDEAAYVGGVTSDELSFTGNGHPSREAQRPSAVAGEDVRLEASVAKITADIRAACERYDDFPDEAVAWQVLAEAKGLNDKARAYFKPLVCNEVHRVRRSMDLAAEKAAFEAMTDGPEDEAQSPSEYAEDASDPSIVVSDPNLDATDQGPAEEPTEAPDETPPAQPTDDAKPTGRAAEREDLPNRVELARLARQEIALGDGVRVTWGEATPAQLAQRMVMLDKKIAGLQATYDGLERIYKLVVSRGASCLDELLERSQAA